MGKEERNGKSKRPMSPGPGAYSDNYKVIKQKSPAYPLGLKTKLDFGSTNNPGPGAYNS
jgi:hypothetical protein